MDSNRLTIKLPGFYDNKGEVMRLDNYYPDWPNVELEKMYKQKNIKLVELKIKKDSL